MILRFASPNKKGDLVNSADYKVSQFVAFLTDCAKEEATVISALLDKGETFVDASSRMSLVAQKMGFRGELKQFSWKDGTIGITCAKNAPREPGSSLTEWDSVLQ